MYKANFDKLRVIMDVIIPAPACLENVNKATKAHVIAICSALCIL